MVADARLPLTAKLLQQCEGEALVIKFGVRRELGASLVYLYDIVEDVEHAIPKAKSVHNISRQAEAIWSQLIKSDTDAKAP